MNETQPVMMQIMQLSTRVTRELEALGAQKCAGGISSANLRILRYMAENAQRDIFQRDIEDALGIRRSTVSKIVQLMERKGLIRRESVESDARLKRLVLTEKSRELQTEATGAVHALEQRITGDLSPDELRTLRQLLAKISSNLYDIHEEAL